MAQSSPTPPTFHLSDFENLQEDLVLLQTSLEQRRVDPQRAREQCREILTAVAELSVEQQLGEYAEFVRRLEAYVQEVEHPQAILGEVFWLLTLDVLDELLAALEMNDAGLKVDTQAMRRHITAFERRLADLPPPDVAPETGPPAPEAAPAKGAPKAGPGNGKTKTAPDRSGAEEAAAEARGDGRADAPPADIEGDEAQALLQRAAAAAAAGQHEEAQQLATAAATELAAQARQRKQDELADLRDKVAVVQAEIDHAEAGLNDGKDAQRTYQDQVETARAKRDEAEGVLHEASEALARVKTELEDAEKRMAELQAVQKDLMMTFENALPAKEEAERAVQQASADLDSGEEAARVATERLDALAESLKELQAQRESMQTRIAALEADLAG